MIMVELQPATKRLKQVIKQHGAVWQVLETRTVPCFNNRTGLFIRSADKAHTRWVLPEHVKPLHHTKG